MCLTKIIVITVQNSSTTWLIITIRCCKWRLHADHFFMNFRLLIYSWTLGQKVPLIFLFGIIFSFFKKTDNLVSCDDQIIWDEVGETDTDRDKMLLELEQECLEVYRRKVDQANRCRAQLRQAIADSEAELAAICSAMGERPVHIRQVRI